MKFEKINNKGQVQLFENNFLESLTKANPIIIWGMYIPIISYSLYYAYTTVGYSFLEISCVFIIALIFWTFFEYLAHRFLFHLISENPKLKRLSYIFHGNHHHYPRDKQRLFMPPVPSVLIASLLFLGQYLILGNYVFVFFAGFIFGYLLYASMHYMIHSIAPPFKLLKPLWSNHHLHHYKNEELGFGVSNTFWDRVFGTMFDVNHETMDKEKVKNLMFEKKEKTK